LRLQYENLLTSLGLPLQILLIAILAYKKIKDNLPLILLCCVSIDYSIPVKIIDNCFFLCYAYIGEYKCDGLPPDEENSWYYSIGCVLGNMSSQVFPATSSKYQQWEAEYRQLQEQYEQEMAKMRITETFRQ